MPYIAVLSYPLRFVLIGAAVIAAYYAGLSGDFVFDDIHNIVKNDALDLSELTLHGLVGAATSGDAGPLGRPLAMLSFALERYIAGLDPTVMKATNVAIHGVNAWLVYAVVARLAGLHERRYGPTFIIGPQQFALLVALTWALAPINLTAVLYIVQRMESLATLGMLAGLLAYLHGRIRLAEDKPGAVRWLWAGMGGGMAISLGAKETGVMLPVYALLLEAVFFGLPERGSRARGALARLYMVFLVLPGMAGLAWIGLLGLGDGAFNSRDFGLAERLGTEARVLWHYIAWTLVPQLDVLGVYHDDFTISRGPFTPWTTLPAAVGLLALGISAWLLRRAVPWIALGVLWFFVMHLLVSTVLPLELVHEHRNYLGSMGLIAAVYAALFDVRLAPHRMIAARLCLAVAVVVFFAFTTALRSHQWGDPIRHAEMEMRNHPGSYRAGYDFAARMIRRSGGAGTEAFELGVDKLKELKNTEPHNISVWQTLIAVHAGEGLDHPERWWDEMHAHLANNPVGSSDERSVAKLVDAVVSGGVNLPIGRLKDLLDLAIQKTGGDASLLSKKASLLAKLGETGAAYDVYKRVVVDQPTEPAGWKNLIAFQISRSRFDAAEASISRLEEVDTLGLEANFIGRMRRRLEMARGNN